MSDEENFGAYVDDEDEDQEAFMGNDDDGPQLNKKISTTVDSNYHYEVVDNNQLKALFRGKVVNFKNKFDYLNFADGLFLKILRQNNFMIEKAVSKFQEKIHQMIDDSSLQKVTLDPKEKYMCNILGDEFDAQHVRHFDCGHTFEEECMKEYITEAINQKGPSAIETSCPYEGCQFLVTEEIVRGCCPKKPSDMFQKFTLDDFIKRAPFIIPCVDSKCYYYFAAPENRVSAEGKLPQRTAVCQCGSLTCLGCERVGHDPLNCEMYDQWDKSTGAIQDKLNQDWIKHNTKPCPGCKVGIQKNQGCMHMTCAKCKHEFCWLCLGDWKVHGSSTGGFFACNMYKPEPTTDKDAQNIKKLQFFTDRFSQHKKSFDINVSKFRELKKKYEEKELPNTKGELEKNTVYIANTSIFPGQLDFYKQGYSTVLKCRSFVTYTYPLAYFFNNEKELSLFLQTQYMLEYALEKLDKFFEQNPIDNLVLQNKQGIYLSKDFPAKRQQMITLMNGLEIQFANANKEFKDPSFLKKINIIEHVKMELITDKMLNDGKTPTNKKEVNNNWLCKFCTYYNENNAGQNCVMCNRAGRPKNT